MLDPSSITLGQISSSVRDFAIVGTLIALVWKARGAYEAVTQFFTRVVKHMDVVEAGMNSLLTNHLAHIQEAVEKMSTTQTRIIEGEEVIHVVGEEVKEV